MGGSGLQFPPGTALLDPLLLGPDAGPLLQGQYNPWLVLLSLAVSIFSATMALQTAHIARATDTPLYRQVAIATGAIALGGGIWTMHFIAMLAFELPAHVHYHAGLTLLSMLPAMAASWFALRLLARPESAWPQLLMSGALVGLGIGTMHYSGMAAMHTSLRMRYEPAMFALSIAVAVALAVLALWVGYGLRRTTLSRTPRLLASGTVMGLAITGMHYTGMAATRFIGEAETNSSGPLLDTVPASIALSVATVLVTLLVYALNGLVRLRTLYRQLEESQSRLRETAASAERAAAAKSTFMANMSHEIRTPMNAIIGFTELLLQGDLTPLQRSHLNTIRTSSRSLLGLLNDILDTTRLEKGALTLETLDFSLKGLAAQIESSLRLGAESKGLTLTTHYPAEMSEHFRGDALRLLQVLTNLVGNAIKFTERGGVELHFDYEEGWVHLQVRDSGIGMTPQQLASIFAPFTQADTSISRRFGGSGLGTTIARQLVELMGGSIDVESEPGRGSIFHVRLPLPVGNKPAARDTVAPLPSLPPLALLVADDIAQNVELLTLTLERQGHNVTVARDGDEVVERFRSGHFDLVLMDVHMPQTDGLQATRLIRQHERATAATPTPIIALTASVLADDRNAARQAGMDGFAVKPLDLPQLFDEMARVLQLQRAPLCGPNGDTEPVASLIDWHTGISLWGSRARLARTMHRFLDTLDQHHPLPAAGAVDIDWKALLFSLHGLRGAAGNLALPAIAELAAQLERAARSGGAHEPLWPLLAQLQTLLLDARRELTASGLLDDEQPQVAAAPASEPSTLQTQLTRLAARLAHNELDDALLDALCETLAGCGERERARALRMAVDNFEFDAAQAILRQLSATAIATAAE